VLLIFDIQHILNKMRSTMPAKNPAITSSVVAQLNALGEQIRAQRKALHINATTVAEAAGLSRVTLHRIEKGEPSVTIGAYFNVLAALNMHFQIGTGTAESEHSEAEDRQNMIPARIRLSEYPQLKQLAWQIHGTEELTPREALGIYERNARHLDLPNMSLREQHLLSALRLGLGDANGSV
jgi:transcriptional regulator with XRE-family HTH domain